MNTASSARTIGQYTGAHPLARRFYSVIDRRVPVSVKRALYAGTRVQCPCCQSALRAFRRRWISDGAPNVQCPVCGSLERQRLLALLLRTLRLRLGSRVLHFAPEPAMRHVWATVPGLRVTTLDLCAPQVTVRGDITRLPFPDARFDVILCSHVLEHIPDDAAALRELRRVLTPEGQAIIFVPLSKHRTHEDWTITTPEGRLAAFGQADHVRVYGTDAETRIAAAGFTVETQHPYRTASPEHRVRYGLADEPVFLAQR